ncbi:MAG: helix-turn-helix domain-containing protein [Solirubrobacterales bacterium]
MAGEQFKVNDRKRVVAVGKSLASDYRVSILIALANEGAASATILIRRGHAEAIALSNVSYHLTKLLEAGITEEVRRREGRGSTERHYDLTDLGRKLATIITEIGR